MKLSFHNHTEYSWDCLISLADLEQHCLAQGIDAITITDHNEVAGALQAAKQFTKVKVIVGEEINTREGEVVGIFLTKKIDPGMPLAETLNQIHAQGGLAVVVHPCDRLRSHVLEPESLAKHKDDIDIIEVFNSRTVFRADNTKALALAEKFNKPVIAGNDGHTLGEVGLTTMDMPEFADAKTFLKHLDAAKQSTRQAPVWVHAITKWVKWTHVYRAPK